MTPPPTLPFSGSRPSHTKIVATVGPASDTEKLTADLIHAGVNVFRLNMAHGKTDVSQQRLDRIRKVSAELGIPVAILADLAGPKMRLGEIPGGSYVCDPAKPVRFVRGVSTTEPNSFTTTYDPLIDDVKPGDRIMLADGTVVCEVVSKTDDAILCNVVQGGTVRSRQGVNLPGSKLSIKTLQPIDIENAKWAVGAGVDFLGLSFVRSAEDIEELRAILREATKPNEPQTQIIAKIEKPEAVAALDSIVDAADGIMVARGDLGVETDIAKIAVVQKRIIRTCRRKNKPVIVATQMLESMHTETMPTRAEATDVANAILDGTDACMLSGETAVGQHPVLAVEMMHRIALETEQLVHERLRDEVGRQYLRMARAARTSGNGNPGRVDLPDAASETAVHLAEVSGAVSIFAISKSGRTVLRLSKLRHSAMTIGCSTNDVALRRMCLYWGVLPVRLAATTPRQMLEEILQRGQTDGYFKQGDRIVLLSDPSGGTENRRLIYVHEI